MKLIHKLILNTLFFVLLLVCLPAMVFNKLTNRSTKLAETLLIMNEIRMKRNKSK